LTYAAQPAASPVSWPLASIPIYYWRRQVMLEQQRIAGGHMVTPRRH
jgi:hypothetical protein